jgi:uncharacterized protein DUF2589
MPINMGDQFKGLPMGDLIGGPLMAACDAQVRLANSTATFIQQIGFRPSAAKAKADANNPNPAFVPGEMDVRTVSFRFNRPAAVQPPREPGDKSPVVVATEQVELEVPLLAIVKIPSLAINTVDITFDMEVKNSERTSETEDQKGSFSADASVGWGPFSLRVHVEGSVATHKENTRQTDQSARYHVQVRAEDKGMPEGLAKVLDMMNSAIAPKTITAVDAKTGDFKHEQAPVAHAALDAKPDSEGIHTVVGDDGLDHEPVSAAAPRERGRVVKARVLEELADA